MNVFEDFELYNLVAAVVNDIEWTEVTSFHEQATRYLNSSDSVQQKFDKDITVAAQILKKDFGRLDFNLDSDDAMEYREEIIDELTDKVCNILPQYLI